jgi:hypothetical protein
MVRRTIRLLVVEDSPSFQYLIQKRLALAGI